MSGRSPRKIANLRQVEAGTSGGVSIPGTLAALAGAFLVASVAGIGWGYYHLPGDENPATLVLLATGGGFLGCLIDSLMGATVQVTYFCPKCQRPTELRVHHCGTPTIRERGIPWINNDVVNAMSVAAGALLAVIISLSR